MAAGIAVTPHRYVAPEYLSRSWPREWRPRAACRDEDLDLMFPEDARGDRRRARANRDASRRICGGCPVTVPCLASALLAGDTTYGMRAGLTPKERRTLPDPAGDPTAAYAIAQDCLYPVGAA